MSTLNDYPKLSQSLKSSSTNNIKILHRLIFGENGDRKNRSRLREFSGFFAIQRTQFGTGLKLRPKYFGPYEVTKVNKHDRYELQKIGQHEGPNVTSTSADKMKKWFHLFPERCGRRGHQDARVDVSYSQTTSEAMNELK
ncbi:blastopia polyprotein [Trichonephila clavipes]|nr:blastopia polyprotein [Trichonephila clavipes]